MISECFTIQIKENANNLRIISNKIYPSNQSPICKEIDYEKNKNHGEENSFS